MFILLMVPVLLFSSGTTGAAQGAPYPCIPTTINTAGAENKTSEGGGLGFGAILPAVKDKVDVVFQTLLGAGIGHFGTTSGPDVTYNPQGSLVPVKAIQAVLGIELTPRQSLTSIFTAAESTIGARVTSFPLRIHFFGATTTGNGTSGYGYQYANDSTCQIEDFTTGLPTSTTNGLSTTDTDCSGMTKRVWAIQSQLWYRIYKGQAGTVQFGASYAYVDRQAWAGRGPGPETQRGDQYCRAGVAQDHEQHFYDRVPLLLAINDLRRIFA